MENFVRIISFVIILGTYEILNLIIVNFLINFANLLNKVGVGVAKSKELNLVKMYQKQ